MNIERAFFLGILQGLTEFLPVSSSGHLVLAQQLFGLKEPQLFFDVAVHVGTLLAVLLTFRADLLDMLRDCFKFLLSTRLRPSRIRTSEVSDSVRMVSMIVVGSLPTAVIGLLLRSVAESLFASIAVVGLSLWATGIVLFLSRWSRQGRDDLGTSSLAHAFLIGLAQGAAITPGLSRSGITITAGLLLGLSPELSFRFSFLLSIPAILGALALEVYHVGGQYPEWHLVAAGFFSALLVGWAALWLLRALVGKGKLFYFAPYCLLVGTIALVFAF
ncbi:MAG: undecaprenyl-diphosphate phosphatase [Deltaproteobacteria bacterium]|nr:MAG: undecaprenyl-diphosphate phosphatase [Deltaproteobacteria bacterium]